MPFLLKLRHGISIFFAAALNTLLRLVFEDRFRWLAGKIRERSACRRNASGRLAFLQGL
jgi:fido (protein-threonine AMPylation protein)